MIEVTRLNGISIVVNADLIEQVQTTPDTIIVLLNGSKIVVQESPKELTQKVIQYRAAIRNQASCVHSE